MPLRHALPLALRFALPCGVLLAAPAAGAQRASFQGLDGLRGPGSIAQAFGVSADGAVVVGNSSVDAHPQVQGFVWTAAGGTVPLGDLPGGEVRSQGLAVSADGAVVVGQSGSQFDRWEAFRWSGGAMAGLGSLVPGLAISAALGASADGAVVVGSSIAGQDGHTEAFRWAGGMGGLGDLPGGDAFSQAFGVSADGAVVVGDGSTADGPGAFRWTAATGMVALGAFPGGAVSRARAVSADGSTVVGQANTAETAEPFLWTEADGLVPLGDLPGGAVQGIARAVSADGATVVGASVGASTQDEAFVWTAAEGMRALRAVLVEALGADTAAIAGWRLLEATGVSADGTVIVGNGVAPGTGFVRAWRAVLRRDAVTAPGEDSLVVAGTRVTVRYTLPGAARVDLAYTTDHPFDPADVTAVTIASDQPNTGTFAWDVPAGLLSPTVRLLVESVEGAERVFSARFRVRPLRMARVRADSTYELFRPNQHGWAFANEEPQLFPPAWRALPQFQYGGGLDPFTGQPYDAALFTSAVVAAGPEAFPDWPSWVRAFGQPCCYAGADYRPSAVLDWQAVAFPWRGSCAGMSSLALMAFADSARFGAVFPAIGPVGRIGEVTDSLDRRPDIREAINARHAYNWGRSYRDRVAVAEGQRPRQALEEIRAMLRRDERSGDAWLYLRNGDGPGGSGAHAVVPYAVSPFGAGVFDVQVYDPNEPNGFLSFVRVDSTQNRWTFGGLNWAGGEGMYLVDPVEAYYGPAVPTAARGGPPVAAFGGGAPLAVNATPGARVTLTDAAGRRIGYADGATFDEMPDGYPDVPAVGGPTPPVGYYVPAGRYRLALADAPGGRARAAFDAGGATLLFAREGAAPGQTDALVLEPDGLLRVANPDGDARTVALGALAVHSGGLDEERLFAVEGLTLAGPDSLRMRAEGDADLRLENPGAPKTYTLALFRSGAAGPGRFRAAGLALAAGATHRLRPDWATLATVALDVDADGDGTFEQTVTIANTVDGAPGPAGGAPGALALDAPAPNPAAGAATLRYDVATAGPVRLAVYDVLGREVAVLVDGALGAGRHEAVLEAGRLAPGVYVVRLTAGTETRARRLTVAR